MSTRRRDPLPLSPENLSTRCASRPPWRDLLWIVTRLGKSNHHLEIYFECSSTWCAMRMHWLCDLKLVWKKNCSQSLSSTFLEQKGSNSIKVALIFLVVISSSRFSIDIIHTTIPMNSLCDRASITTDTIYERLFDGKNCFDTWRFENQCYLSCTHSCWALDGLLTRRFVPSLHASNIICCQAKEIATQTAVRAGDCTKCWWFGDSSTVTIIWANIITRSPWPC